MPWQEIIGKATMLTWKATISIALFILWGLAAPGRSGDRPPRPVVLTTDCGADIDDQWTLAHLVLSPEFDLLGIVTTHAPTLADSAAQTSARIAAEVLDHLPIKTRPPIFAGSSLPLASKTKPHPNSGVDFILNQSRGHSPRRRLVVLVIGAATDVASALLTDPTLGDRIEIIAMGFEKWPDGGDPWNVKNDVKAWQILLESRAPITVGDAAVTGRDLIMPRDRPHQLLGRSGRPARYLADLHTAWLEKNPDLCQTVTGRRDLWPVWDEVTVAYLLGLTQSKVYPRPRLGDDLRFDHQPSRANAPTIRWITAVDSKRLWQNLRTKLHAHETRQTHQKTEEFYMSSGRRPETMKPG
jgi:inosine-uridine nucleoside N-ribohydrolase